MEYKTTPMLAKEVDGRTVSGFPSIFGNVDDGGDITQKGAFKKTIREQRGRIKHLWMHDAWTPPTANVKELAEVGVEDLPDEVKKKYPDATGGLLLVREYLNTQRGEEILQGIVSGAINEMSYGYDAVKWDTEERETDDGKTYFIRHLKEVRLWDTSDVNWGMNRATVASKTFPHLNAYKDIIEPEQFELLTTLADLTERVITPEYLKAGRQLSTRYLERFKDALEQLNEVLLQAEPPEEPLDLKALTSTLLTRLAIVEREATFLGV